MLAFLAAIESGADRSKCERLYETYNHLMFYVANGILNDSHAAEDAVQRAFVKIIDYLQKIDEINCPKTKGLMVIIVKRVAIDLYNRRRRRGETPYDELAETPGALDAADGVTAAILRLPPLYAEEAAVSKRITRGKEKLRALLEEEGYYVP